MWKEFGIKPEEINGYANDWVEDMIVIANAEGQESEREMDVMRAKTQADEAKKRAGVGQSKLIGMRR